MILSVEKLSHSYGVRTLFKDVTFDRISAAES